MKVKALTSFTGVLSMTANEVREISDEAVLKDLVEAGFVIPVEKEPEPETTTPEPETTTPEPGEVAPVQQKKGRKKKDEDSGTDK
ncbi:hypothetical protein DWW96_10820 [Eubacterium sp. AF17-7]|uniref:hypothetical protein n=1 Tax=Eubacterium sp. AF17-7 TaxID=2293105 RepID=UPI000E47CF9F|nr:hypothetical protein [Eubacterium sp. AF17-7]RGG63427.1 hypothetical protein DWW96_10820 [Eubacterium sp. AF17-7]